MYWLDSINLQMTVQILVFSFSSIFFATLITWLSTGKSSTKKRLQHLLEEPHKIGQTYQEEGFTVRWAKPIAELFLPEENWKRSHIKSRLIIAGFRKPAAIYIYLASKIILTLIFSLLTFTVLIVLNVLDLEKQQALYILAVASILGFFLPDIYLSHKKENRIQTMTEEFPDALDLLVVCVEAGLSLDAGIQKVARELMVAHSALGEELAMVNLELRAGKSRTEALKGLGDRTGIDDIKSLTSILIQAENFGTSIASALREHANEMRNIRIQRAKEKAAKLPVKLTFPILLFIFPSIFLVILGPAVIRIFERFLTAG